MSKKILIKVLEDLGAKDKYAVIMRGLPGSGKSSFISIVSNTFEDVAVHSTDNYYLDKDDNYNFDPSRIGEFHEKNFSAFKQDVESGTNIVMCDNTNLSKWEYEKYIAVSKDNMYKVLAVVFTPDDIAVHAKRNTHNVPRAVLERMVDKFSKNFKTVGADKEFIDENYVTLAEEVVKEIKDAAE